MFAQSFFSYPQACSSQNWPKCRPQACPAQVPHGTFGSLPWLALRMGPGYWRYLAGSLLQALLGDRPLVACVFHAGRQRPREGQGPAQGHTVHRCGSWEPGCPDSLPFTPFSKVTYSVKPSLHPSPYPGRIWCPLGPRSPSGSCHQSPDHAALQSPLVHLPPWGQMRPGTEVATVTVNE